MRPDLLAQARKIVAAPSLGAMFDAAKGTAFAPQQRRDEIVPFCEMLAERRAGPALEIGTGRGLTALMLAWACGRAVTVGIPEKLRGLAVARERALKDVGVSVLRADSHDSATRALARRMLGGKAPGVLFLDGDHTYEGLKLDYERYAPLVRPGGIVALHDTRPSRSGLGAVRLVEELRKKHAMTDIWAEGEKLRGYGISFLVKEPA